MDESELLRPWARQDEQGRIHPLVCHLIDTMETARVLQPTLLGDRVREELGQMFAPLTGADRDQTTAWVALLCGLADLGMYSPAYQAHDLGPALERLPASEHELLKATASGHHLGVGARHERVTSVHVHLELAALGVRQRISLTLGDVLAGHHGRLPEPGATLQLARTRANLLRGDLGNGPWRSGRSAMVGALARLAGVDFHTPAWGQVGERVDRQAGTRALNALLALATISVQASADAHTFPCEAEPGPLEQYRVRAAQRAAQAQAQVQVEVGTWEVRTSREQWLFGRQSLVEGTAQLHTRDGWIPCPRPGPFARML